MPRSRYRFVGNDARCFLRPEHWRWSSARNYLGMPGLIDVDRDWLGS